MPVASIIGWQFWEPDWVSVTFCGAPSMYPKAWTVPCFGTVHYLHFRDTENHVVGKDHGPTTCGKYQINTDEWDLDVWCRLDLCAKLHSQNNHDFKAIKGREMSQENIMISLTQHGSVWSGGERKVREKILDPWWMLGMKQRWTQWWFRTWWKQQINLWKMSPNSERLTFCYYQQWSLIQLSNHYNSHPAIDSTKVFTGK